MLEPLAQRASMGGDRPRLGLRAAFAAAGGDVGRRPSASGRVVVGLFDLPEWRAWLPEARALLDPGERHRVARRHFVHHREELALAYALHRLLLARVMACDPLDVPLWRDARGCPRVAEGAWTTSLSHADGCCAVAAMLGGPLGIDIEPAGKASGMAAIADRVCHPLDTAALAHLAPTDRSAALLAIWVRKEALLKAAGVGLAREMATFPAARDGRLPLTERADAWSEVKLLGGGPGHVVGLAAPPGAQVSSAWWRPPAGLLPDRTAPRAVDRPYATD